MLLSLLVLFDAMAYFLGIIGGFTLHCVNHRIAVLESASPFTEPNIQRSRFSEGVSHSSSRMITLRSETRRWLPANLPALTSVRAS